MANGTPYEIHPCIDPDRHFTCQRWKDEIRKAWQDLSPLSRWERFASAIPNLSEKQLDYLTDIDGKDRVAWCAVIVENDQYRGIGLSRFTKVLDEVDTAEFAVTVIDEFQGQGVGQALLEQLIKSARQNGFKVLRGYILRGNKRMMSLCEHFHASFRTEGTFVRVDIPIR